MTETDGRESVRAAGTAIVVWREALALRDSKPALYIREQQYRLGVGRRYDARRGPWVWD